MSNNEYEIIGNGIGSDTFEIAEFVVRQRAAAKLASLASIPKPEPVVEPKVSWPDIIIPGL